MLVVNQPNRTRQNLQRLELVARLNYISLFNFFFYILNFPYLCIPYLVYTTTLLLLLFILSNINVIHDYSPAGVIMSLLIMTTSWSLDMNVIETSGSKPLGHFLVKQSILQQTNTNGEQKHKVITSIHETTSLHY